MTYYIVLATYANGIFQETWKLDTVEELELEIEFIMNAKWTINGIVTVTEAK